jgi:hypothetical protein
MIKLLVSDDYRAVAETGGRAVFYAVTGVVF